MVLQAGGSEPGQALAAATVDVVFSVEQDIDEAGARYAAFKARLPALGRTDREAFDTLAKLQGFVASSNALALLSDRLGVDMGRYPLNGPVPELALPDTLGEWFGTSAADGFNIMPPYFLGGFDAFIDLVVPILQERGWFRRSRLWPHLARHAWADAAGACCVRVETLDR